MRWSKKLLAFFPFVLVFVASLYHTSDLDLGWHLKYGQYFWQHHQVLRINTLSSQMPLYGWVNTSWATDPLIYLVFSKFSFFGITLLGALTATLTYLFFSLAARLTLYQQAFLFPVLLYLEEPLYSASFRVQLLSLLFLGLMFYILEISKTNYKKLLLLIPLFFAWSNFHGGFLLGILLLGLFMTLSLLLQFLKAKKKNFLFKESLFYAAILFGCLTVALVNPFGLGIVSELSHHALKTWQKHIIEWLPFDFLSALWLKNLLFSFFVLIGISYLLLKKQFLKNLPHIGIALILLIMSYLQRRWAWPFYFAAIPILAPLLSLITPKKQNTQTPTAIIILSVFIAFQLFGKLPLSNFLSMNWQTYCANYTQCSPQAADYLVKNNLTANLLTFYDWGGFLIWNYPQIKPSIDGRMPSWVDQNGQSPFEKYYAFQQNFLDIDESAYNVVLMSPTKPLYWRLMQLTATGQWALKYNDQFSGVFVKNKNLLKSQ